MLKAIHQKLSAERKLAKARSKERDLAQEQEVGEGEKEAPTSAGRKRGKKEGAESGEKHDTREETEEAEVEDKEENRERREREQRRHKESVKVVSIT